MGWALALQPQQADRILAADRAALRDAEPRIRIGDVSTGDGRLSFMLEDAGDIDRTRELLTPLMNGEGLVAAAAWPTLDESLLVEDEVTIAVQHMGKLRDTLTAPKGASKDDLQALALASENVQRSIDGADIRKVIVVPDRLVNIVT